jgi:glycosyltransferase involved in cell wall biosynthesis
MGNSNPLVSAIIPTYNRAHIIGEAVDSALAQTYPHIEVIVVDDGSKDDTLARLQQYGNRIRVVNQANAGPAAARNRGIAVSRGELIAFLDSDDIWLPSKIERQVALLRRAGESVPCCLCNIMMKWNSGDRASFDMALLKPSAEEGVWLNPDEVLATRFVLFNQGIMIRREVLEKIGVFDESIRYLEDVEFPLRLSLEGPWAFIGTPLVVWRESMANSVYKDSQREALCTSECMVKVLETHLARVERASRDVRLRRHVSRALKGARRHLWTVRMSQKNSWRSILAACIETIDRYRSALFRRSPWFPEMKVALVQSRDELSPVPGFHAPRKDHGSAERLVG